MHLSYSFVDNAFGIAGVCGLIPSLLNLPKLSIVIGLGPSDCIGSDAWRQAGLAVPPKDITSQGWNAVLKHLREVRVHICVAESVPSSMHDLPKSPVTQSCSRRHSLPQINAVHIRAKHQLLLSAPPAATLDCSALYDPLMLLSALDTPPPRLQVVLSVACAFALIPVDRLPLSEMPCCIHAAHDMAHTWHSCCRQENRRVVESTLARPHSRAFTAAAAVHDAGRI